MENDLSEVLEGADTPEIQTAPEPQGEIQQQETQQPEPPSGEEPQPSQSEPNEVAGLKAAIADLRERKRTEEAARRDLERQLAEFQQRQPQPQQQQRDPNQEPELSQFETYEDYIKALGRWTYTQEAQETMRRQSENAEQRRKAEVAMGYTQRAAQFAAAVPDYYTVAHGIPEAMMTEAMTNVIAESDNGPAIAYFLGQNLNEAARIAQLSPVQTAWALFNIGNNVNKVEGAIQQETQPQRLPGSFSNERAAVSNGQEPFVEPTLEELLN